MQQIAWSLDRTTLKKMGISALLLAAGAVLTYLADNGLKLIGAVGIPAEYQPMVLAGFTWAVNSVKEFIKGQE